MTLNDEMIVFESCTYFIENGSQNLFKYMEYDDLYLSFEVMIYLLFWLLVLQVKGIEYSKFETDTMKSICVAFCISIIYKLLIF